MLVKLFETGQTGELMEMTAWFDGETEFPSREGWFDWIFATGEHFKCFWDPEGEQWHAGVWPNAAGLGIFRSARGSWRGIFPDFISSTVDTEF
jgi:hypothetical protein